MKKLLIVTTTLMLSASVIAGDTSVRGISLEDDAGAAKSRLEGKVVSGEMQAAKKMGLRGFIETMGKDADQELRFAARPDGSIYRIRYEVRVPLAEMNAIKNSVCDNFEITNQECTGQLMLTPQDPRQPRPYFEAAGPLATGGHYQIWLNPIVRDTNPFSGKKTYHKTDGVLKIYQLAEQEEIQVYQKWKQKQTRNNGVASTSIEQKKASKSYY